MDRALSSIDASTELRHLHEHFKTQYSSESLFVEPTLEEKFGTPALDQLQQFVTQTNEVSLLLTGEPGSGKSTLLKRLADSCWNNFFNEKKDSHENQIWVPVYISLAEIATEKLRQRLLQFYIRNLSNINEAHKITRNASFSLLLLLDGFDEISTEMRMNLVTENGWLESWAKLNKFKVIISCRSELLHSAENWRDWFKIPNEPLQQVQLLPFNDTQIEHYIKKYLSRQSAQPTSSSIDVNGAKVDASADDWSQSETYLKYLKEKFPGLLTLVRNPFILEMTVANLPTVVTKLQEQPDSQSLTRKKIYQIFIHGYLSRGAKRIHKKNQQLTVEEWTLCLWCYTQNLAVSCFRQGFSLGSIVSIETETLNPHLLTPNQKLQCDEVLQGYPELYEAHRELLGDSNILKLLRSESLLERREINGEQQFNFPHRSVVEFFTASNLFQNLLFVEQGLEQVIRRSSADEADAALEVEIKDDEASHAPLASTQVMRSFLTYPLSQESQITLYLVDAAQDLEFREKLMNIVMCSKGPQGDYYAIAAANAMTILCAVRTSFTYQDLAGIHIPGADCRFGLFFNTNLDGANLCNVNFDNACLDQASMKGALVDGMKLGQRPQIQTKLPITQLQMNSHPDFPGWLAVSRDSQSIYIQAISQRSTDNKASKPITIKLSKKWGKVSDVALNSEGTKIAIAFKTGWIREFKLILKTGKFKKLPSLNLNPSNRSQQRSIGSCLSSTSAVDDEKRVTRFATRLSFSPKIKGKPLRLAMGITEENKETGDEHFISVWSRDKKSLSWIQITDWNSDEGCAFAVFGKLMAEKCRQLAWANSGDLLAEVGEGGLIKIWDVTKPQEPSREHLMPEKPVSSLIFSMDNRSLFIITNTLFARSKIILYARDSTSHLMGDFEYLEHPEFESALESNQIHQLALSPNGQWLAVTASGWKNSIVILIWDLVNKKMIDKLSLGTQFEPHYPLTFSSDGNTLAVAIGNTVVRWDLDQPTPLLSSQLDVDDRIVWQDFSADGNNLVTQRGVTLSFHRVEDHNVQFKMRLAYLPNTSLYRVIVPGGGLFIIGIILDTLERIVKFASQPTPVTSVIAPEFPSFLKNELTKYKVTHINALAFSADGRVLILAVERKVFLYQTDSSAPPEPTILKFDESILNIVVSPNNDHVALLDMVHRVHLVSLNDPPDQPADILYDDKQSTTCSSMAFSSDNLLATSRIGVVDRQSRINLHDLKTRTDIEFSRFSDANDSQVYQHLSFSPNGQMLATCTYGHQAQVQFWQIIRQPNDQMISKFISQCPASSPTQLYWKQDDHLLVATVSGGVHHYKPSLSDNADWQCAQISFHDHLSANSLVLNGCIGLPPEHHQLLKEKGAKGNPSTTSPARIRDSITREKVPHLEHEEAIIELDLQLSVISELNINYDDYAIHLCRNTTSQVPEHVFLLVEGFDAYGLAFFLRYELVTTGCAPGTACIRRKDNIPGLKYHSSNIEFAARRALVENFIKIEDLCLLSWKVPRKQVLQLIHNIEIDMESPIPYAIRGNQASAVDFFKGNGAHNCFSWLKEKLLTIAPEAKDPIRCNLEAKYRLVELAFVKPSWYVKEESPPRCTVM